MEGKCRSSLRFQDCSIPTRAKWNFNNSSQQLFAWQVEECKGTSRNQSKRKKKKKVWRWGGRVKNSIQLIYRSLPSSWEVNSCHLVKSGKTKTFPHKSQATAICKELSPFITCGIKLSQEKKLAWLKCRGALPTDCKTIKMRGIW